MSEPKWEYDSESRAIVADGQYIAKLSPRAGDSQGDLICSAPALLKALQDVPTPQPPDSALTTYPKQWQDDYRKWHRTVRAEALKAAGVK